MARRPISPHELPPVLPVFPLAGALLLPYSQRPLNIFEARYVALVDHALRTDRLIGLIQPADFSAEESPPGAVALQRVGCVGRITHFEDQDERYLIVLDGLCRFELGDELAASTPFRQFRVRTEGFAEDFNRTEGEGGVDRPRFIKMMRDYADYASITMNWQEIDQTGTADLVNFCCMVSPYGAADKQALLEAKSLGERAETLIALAELEMARDGAGVPLQ